MDRESALADLPPLLALALRLHAQGRDPSEIAHRLGIEPEGVPTLLALAEAKLTRALEHDEC